MKGGRGQRPFRARSALQRAVRSLGTRLALMMTVILFGTVSMVAWWGTRHQSQMLHQEEIEQAETLAATLVGSLHVLMENGEGTLARNWLQRMQKTPGVEAIDVLRRNGAIAFRDTRTIERVNRFLGEKRFHRKPLPPVRAPEDDRRWAQKAVTGRKDVIRDAPGRLQLFVPIPFKPVCARCHGYDPHPVRGVLLLTFSTHTAETRIREMRVLLWELAAAVSLLLGIALWAGLRRLILDPVAQLYTALRQAGAGDRTHRLVWKRRDELGELAAGFNAMQEKLKTRNALIQAIVQHAPNAMIVADDKGRIRSFNPAAERLFGYSEKEVIGRNVRILMPEPYRSAHDSYIRRYLETGIPHIIGTSGRELTAVRKDGNSFPIELLVAEIPFEDRRHFLGIVQDISERKRHEAELVHMTLHDPLTGLPNRRALAERMDEAVTMQKAFALFYLGLNRFRAVNEVLGHATGDQALVKTGKRIKAACGRTAVMARIGGDIFAVYWPGLHDPDKVTETAHKLLDCMRQPMQLQRYSIDVDARIGIALFPDHGQSAEEILRRAEIAMDAAKRQQVSCAFYDKAMERYQAEHLALVGELRQAIVGGELQLHYQPKIDMRSRRIAGVEALVRWHHAKKGFIPPDMFIPLAEESGLIHDFTSWLLDAAAKQAAAWRRQGLPLTIAVNLAARNLTEADLPDRIHALLRRRRLKPEALMLEITETGMMADPKRARAMLCRIHEMGIALSIDDFGTGYSSLAYLKDLPLDELKVDQSFVGVMAHDESSKKIVTATIQLAHNLGLTVTAEGVESEEAWRLLAAMGCDRAQGYYMGRPMAAKEFEQWLRKSPWGKIE